MVRFSQAFGDSLEAWAESLLGLGFVMECAVNNEARDFGENRSRQVLCMAAGMSASHALRRGHLGRGWLVGV
jgi:hypothetical protein